MQIIDAHIHVWRSSDDHRIWVREGIAALRQDSTIAAFAEVASVDGVIVIEAAETLAETIDLCTALETEPLVKGVVGWIDLAAPGAGDLIERLSAFHLFKGVRLLPAFAVDRSWEPSTALAPGLRALERHDLTLDVLAAPDQLSAVQRIKDLSPELTVVVNHGGRPLVMCGLQRDWVDAIRALARDTDVRCKLSGLIERAGFDWTPETLRPFVSELVDAFGPLRLAFASNWPMLELNGAHRRWLEAARQLLDDFGLTEVEMSAIFARTASDVYGLDNSGTDREPAHV